MKAALIQLNASDDPAANLSATRALVAEASGADLIVTPEVTNCVSASRTHQQEVLRLEADDQTLAALRADAVTFGCWILIGSLAVKTSDPNGRFANRCILIGPDGQVHARYDKIHMFDVQVSETETFRESAGYRPGEVAVLADTPLGRIGLTICYDMRFPALYRTLAQAGAQVITVPSAFLPSTGAAHWHTLLRARAVETGCFILAPAQTGTHAATRGKQRKTFGHSVVVAPWGEVLADAGTETGVTLVDLDLSQVSKARHRIPSLTHDRNVMVP